VALGGIGLAAALAPLVARTALRPVADLSDAAEHVARTRDLSRRIDSSSPDELGRLARSYNTMLAALERSMGQQRQLVADASHELRTPLTSLRTNVEVLAAEKGMAPEDRRRLLRDVVGQLEELSVLVGDLVDLARDRADEEHAEDLRLDELVGEVVERARRRHPEREFRLEAEPTLVRGVAARLDRAVGNLLDNAQKWSPPGAPVEVRVSAGEVEVRDHGPGIAEEDLPFVFDRFYRAAAARELPGSGLGLAIVRQVAEAHGGQATAEPAAGGGTRLRLRLGAIPSTASTAPR
ncbi:MAG: HAMP domain-containing histidine kinase, partial [Actinomycetota bacterium]|nr:HAMP domain-containing histidine kinase [Actinomycetota bacterium]